MGDQTCPNVHTPPPGPRSEALLKHDLTREIVYAMERKGVVPIYEPAFNYFRPTPALNQPPELFALGCDIVEECVAEVSKAHAKGVR